MAHHAHTPLTRTPRGSRARGSPQRSPSCPPRYPPCPARALPPHDQARAGRPCHAQHLVYCHRGHRLRHLAAAQLHTTATYTAVTRGRKHKHLVRKDSVSHAKPNAPNNLHYTYTHRRCRRLKLHVSTQSRLTTDTMPHRAVHIHAAATRRSPTHSRTRAHACTRTSGQPREHRTTITASTTPSTAAADPAGAPSRASRDPSQGAMKPGVAAPARERRDESPPTW
jgi:hypothetical protein